MQKYFTTKNLLALFTWFCVVSVATAHTPGSDFGAEKSLEFIQNRNQWDAQVKFKADLFGGQLFLTQNRWVFNFVDPKQIVKAHPHKQVETSETTPEKMRTHAYAISFLKANPAVQLKTARKTPGFRNYFLGNDPSHWASEVYAYEEIQYPELYPGIEARLYEQKQKLKYEFEIQPGANPNQIRMQYDGADKLHLENGNLVITTSVNTVTEQKPFAYQVIKGVVKEVACHFKLTGNVLSFSFPKGYRKKLPLVIDPTLVYSSYTRSTADNWGFTATYDGQGNMYTGGVVFYYNGGNFPVTLGAAQTFQRGTCDIGLMKFNPNTAGPASRVWATYLGGSSVEAPHSLVVNSQNQLLILGTTNSSDFPVTNGSYNTQFKGGPNIDPLGFGIGFLNYIGGSDLFITKLAANGNALQASTFFGGTGNDGLLNGAALFQLPVSPLVRNYGDQFRCDITTDASDNIYLTSSTSSFDFPVKNAFQNNFAGGSNDAVISKFDSNLSNLLWSSYLGGAGNDAAYSIQVDSLANVYVCGGTTSANLQQTNGAFKPNFLTGGGSNTVEGFASKISSAGNTASLVRTTYIGASPGYDQAYFLQLDVSSNVYLLGQSAALYPVFPANGANRPFNGRGGQQFIQKLNSDLTTNIFSTNFGSGNGQFNISPTAFLVDNCERIFVCGWGGDDNAPPQTTNGPNYVGGSTSNLLVTPNAIQTQTDGSDFYLMQLSQNALNLEYATYLGGPNAQSAEHVDGGTSRFDKRGFVYQAVCAGCRGTNNFPTTPNAWSTANGNSLVQNGNCNNAAFKFDFAVTSSIAGGAQKVCANNGPFQILGATPAGGTWSGDGVSPAGVFTPSQALIGTHTLTYTVTVGTCTSYATKTIIVNPIPAPSFTGLKNGEYCREDAVVTLVPNLPGGTFKGAGVINSNQWSPEIAGPGSHIITYSYSDLNSCTVEFTDTARVAIPPAMTAGPDEGVCDTSDPFFLSGNSPLGGTWSGPGVTANGLFTPNANLIGSQTLTYSIIKDNCTYKAQKKVVVNPAPDIFTDLVLGDCGTDSSKAGFAPLTVKFNNNTTLGKSFIWDFGDGKASTEATPEHTYTKAGHYTVYLTTDFGHNCTRTSKIVEVTVKDPFLPNIITPNGDQLNDTFQPQVTCLPYTMRLFSRWGHLVYEKNNYQENFDGSNLSAGIYYYYLKDSSNRTWKGWLEIVK